MTEDQVIEATIKIFQIQGWDCIYRTPLTRSSGNTTNYAGVDVIMCKEKEKKFLFIEAKGAPASKATASANFTNVLGTIVKRVRLNSGYFSNEFVDCFKGTTRFDKLKTKAFVTAHGVLSNSEYVIALTEDYKVRSTESIDLAILNMLKIRFLWVSE